MNIKKIIHYQKDTGSTLCGASSPFNRNSIKKTSKISKVSCEFCLKIKTKKELIKKNKCLF